MLRKSITQKPPSFWVRLALGVIFIAAGVNKILHPSAFAQTIYNYQILPDVLINLTAIVLPWLELIIGILLLFGLWLHGSVALVNVLLVAFFGALIFNLARGLDIHCGCFSTSTDGNPATAWYLVRDATFLLMGGYLFRNIILGRELQSDRNV